MTENLINGTKILEGQAVLDLLIKQDFGHFDQSII